MLGVPLRLALRLVAPVLLVLAPLLVLEGFNLARAHQDAIATAELATREAAAHAAEHHRADLLQAQQLLTSLAGRQDVVQPGPFCAPALQRVLDASPRYLNLGVIAADGSVTCSALPLTDSTNLAARPYFQRAMATGEFATGTYQVGVITGQPSLNVAHPFEVGPVRGVVFGALDLAALGESVHGVPLAEHTTLLVLDQEGATLTEHGVADPRTSASMDPDALRADGLIAASTGLGPEGGGGVLVLLPESAATGPAWDRMQRDVAVMLVAALLGIAGAYLLTAGLVGRPVALLVEGFHRVRKGDYDARVPEGLAGEFGELARGFNGMAGAIEQQQDALVAQATTDQVTGLPNWSGFQQWTGDRIQAGEPVACVYLTISGFHDVTATFGYPAADTLLAQVGQRLEQAFPDAVCARVGGNSFGVAVTGADARPERLQSMGERAVHVFQAPFTVQDVPVPVEVLAGVARSPDHAPDADLLLRRAEAAARADGGRHLVFDPAEDEPHTNNLKMVADLHRALEDGELELHYQPLVDPEGGAAEVEALLRWRHEGEYIPPGEFIPVAERSGVMRLIDRWVFRQAVDQARRWQDQGLDVSVSINLSVRSLEDLNFPEYARTVLASAAVPSSRISVEITETALVRFLGDALVVGRRLHDLGIPLAIDDFGVGHSPVQYLRGFPVQRIKLDASLVNDLKASGQANAITRAMLQMAQDLGIESVGEGVEDSRDLAILRAMGCSLSQGFLHARPMPAEAITAWLRDHPPTTTAA